MCARRVDRGQSALLLLACIAFIGMIAVAVAAVGVRLVDRQRAQNAADAAALAGTTAGRTGAGRLAAANDARLVSYAEVGDDVVVIVEVGGERARARATDGP